MKSENVAKPLVVRYVPNVKNQGPLERAAESMSDGMARICRLYGVSPLLGRLFTQLFLSAGPLSLEGLCESLGAAKSSVSVGLRKLEAARVVRRRPPRSDRRDFYELAEDPWAVLDAWSRFYFTPELQMLRETSAGVLAALDAEQHEAPALRARLETWREFGEVLAGLIDTAGHHATGAPPARHITIEREDAP